MRHQTQKVLGDLVEGTHRYSCSCGWASADGTGVGPYMKASLHTYNESVKYKLAQGHDGHCRSLRGGNCNCAHRLAVASA